MPVLNGIEEKPFQIQSVAGRTLSTMNRKPTDSSVYFFDISKADVESNSACLMLMETGVAVMLVLSSYFNTLNAHSMFGVCHCKPVC